MLGTVINQLLHASSQPALQLSGTCLLAGQVAQPWAEYLTERRPLLLAVLCAAPGFAVFKPAATSSETAHSAIGQLFDSFVTAVAQHQASTATTKQWASLALAVQAQLACILVSTSVNSSVMSLIIEGVHACRHVLGERRSVMANGHIRRMQDAVEHAELRAQLGPKTRNIAERIAAELAPQLEKTPADRDAASALPQLLTAFLDAWVNAPHFDAQAAQLDYLRGFLQDVVCHVNLPAEAWEILILKLDRELAALATAQLYSSVTPATEVLLASVAHVAVFQRVGYKRTAGPARVPGLQELLLVWMALSCRRESRLSAEFFKALRPEALIAAGFECRALQMVFIYLSDDLQHSCEPADVAIMATALAHIINVCASVEHAQLLQAACRPMIAELAARITTTAKDASASQRVEQQISAILLEAVLARALAYDMPQARAILRRRLSGVLNTDVDMLAWRQCRQIATTLAQASSPSPVVEALLSSVQTLSAELEHIVADQFAWPLFWAEELGLVPATVSSPVAEEIAYITSQAAACLRACGDTAHAQLRRDIALRWTLSANLVPLHELRAGLKQLNLNAIPEKWRKLHALILLITQNLTGLYAGVALGKMATPNQKGMRDPTWSLGKLAYLARYGAAKQDAELHWWWSHGISRRTHCEPRATMLSNLRELQQRLQANLPAECAAWVFDASFAPYRSTFGLQQDALEAAGTLWPVLASARQRPVINNLSVLKQVPHTPQTSQQEAT